MKKVTTKLKLNKTNISALKPETLKGGVTGTTCEFTNKYYKTCWNTCATFSPDCIGSNSICPVTTC